MKSNPLVSIVIPVYNGANYLGEAIETALAQTYQNIEIIVVNDGSKDDGATKNVASKYLDRIRYFEKPNGGVASALNVGISQMKGDYFSWLSHDDTYMPDKVKAQVDYLRTLDSDNVILYSDLCFIDENSKFLRDHKVKHVLPESFRINFIMGGVINGCTLLIPSEAFKDCGVFKEELRTTQDYDLWFRFSEKYRFIHMPQVLVGSRLHSLQDTVTLRPTAIKECDAISLDFLNAIPVKEIASNYTKPVPIYYLDFALAMENQGFRSAGRRSYKRAIATMGKLKPKFLGEFLRKSLTYPKLRMRKAFSKNIR